MKKNWFESIVGTVILFFSIYAFMIFFEKNSDHEKNEIKQIKAKFLKLGGVIVGNDVKLRGIKVGAVLKIIIDENYFAEVTISINNAINIPIDSDLSIQSEGILGNKYLAINPGSESNFLDSDNYFSKVKDYESIEDQVSKIIFLATQ